MMIIVDKPYTSDLTAAYLVESGVPVLANAEARAATADRPAALLADDEFARLVDSGRRLYTTSENALEWVLGHVGRESVRAGVTAMKDKYRLREVLSPLYPGFYFRRWRADDLAGLDPASLPYPVVLKPVVSFFSLGVHVLTGPADFIQARQALARQRADLRRAYPEGVVGLDDFIIEGYLGGDEYAVDAYFDGEGRPVIVNIMRHDFSGDSDVSDRLYYTGPGIIRDNLDRFTAFLERVNAVLGLVDFPFHVEVRVDGTAVVPIEFNPLRFAGYCTTELTYYAFGYRTYDLYLHDRRPDWDTILAGREDMLYSLVILDKPPGLAADAGIDYDAVCRRFTEVLCLRRFEEPSDPIFGIMFTRTPQSRREEEMEAIMRSDLREFVR